jgi:adenine-specific DNA-methyltransferase
LWLRTAQPRRKLNDLSSNIKCGNSLIDSKAVAGDKAFSWETQFPKVFAKGGFDVIIGNPPYVFGGGLGISNEEKKIFKNIYVSGSGKVNLFTLFVEKGIEILKPFGRISYIIPNTFLRVTSYSHIRKYLLDNTELTDVVDLGGGVFDDAVTSAIIFVSKKVKPNLKSVTNILKDLIGSFTVVAQQHFIDSDYLITTNVTEAQLKLLKKLDSGIIPLGDLSKELIFGMVISGNKDELVFKEETPLLKPFLEGKDIGRYTIKPIHSFINYVPEKIHRPRTIKIFEAPEKLLIQRITGGSRPLKVAYDNNRYYNKESINNLILREDCPFNIKSILGLLNSKLISWLYSVRFTNESTLTVNLSKEYLSKIPIQIDLLSIEKQLIKCVNLLLESNSSLTLFSTKFIKFFTQKYNLSSYSSKLDNWYDLEFGDFIKELNKAVRTSNKQRLKDGLQEVPELTKKDEFEWLDLFEENKQKAQDLQSQINQTDKEIDAMVYELYGLTEDEIKIVEKS